MGVVEGRNCNMVCNMAGHGVPLCDVCHIMEGQLEIPTAPHTGDGCVPAVLWEMPQIMVAHV
jgi:hypothetical protein